MRSRSRKPRQTTGLLGAREEGQLSLPGLNPATSEAPGEAPGPPPTPCRQHDSDEGYVDRNLTPSSGEVQQDAAAPSRRLTADALAKILGLLRRLESRRRSNPGASGGPDCRDPPDSDGPAADATPPCPLGPSEADGPA